MSELRPGLGPLESAVLDVLWKTGTRMSVREVVEGLEDRRPAYTTVSTVLENLRRKGWVDREQVGRLWFYRPLRDRAAHAASIMSGALADSGDPHAALLRFVDEMSAEDVDVLRALLAGIPREEET